MYLILIWVGFLGLRFEVGRGCGKITPPPYLKLVRMMPKICNLVRRYTHMQFQKVYLLLPGTKAFLSLLITSFFCKNNIFTQSNIVGAVLEIF